MINESVIKEIFGEKAITGKTMLFMRSQPSIDMKTGEDPERIGEIETKTETETYIYPRTGKDIVCRTSIGGTLITKVDPFVIDDDADRWDELWACDVIIIPRRKFSTDSFMGVPTSECLKGDYADFREHRWQPKKSKKDNPEWDGQYWHDVTVLEAEQYAEEVARDLGLKEKSKKREKR